MMWLYFRKFIQKNEVSIYKNMWRVAQFGTVFVIWKTWGGAPWGGGRKVLLLVELQAKASDFTEGSALPWIFLCFSSCTDGAESRNASHLYLFDILQNNFKTLFATHFNCSFSPNPNVTPIRFVCTKCMQQLGHIESSIYCPLITLAM